MKKTCGQLRQSWREKLVSRAAMETIYLESFSLYINSLLFKKNLFSLYIYKRKFPKFSNNSKNILNIM